MQLAYFAEQKIGPGDKVILLTAKPSWIPAGDGRFEPATWKYLNYFEERMVRDSGARLSLTITGDRHHYARYEPSGEGADAAPTRLTAGGGGAYLSATHVLPEELKLKTLPRKQGDKLVQQPTVVNTREAIYPTDADSRKLSNGILKLAKLNPAFGRLIGLLYVAIGYSLLSGIDRGSDLHTDANAHLSDFLSRSPGTMTIVLSLLLFGWLFGGLDLKQSRIARMGIAITHSAVHLFVIALVAWATVNIAPDIWDARVFVLLIGGLAAFAVGSSVGPTVFAFCLWAVHKVRGPQSQENANQVFTGQSIIDYKNFLRLHLARDGALTIYPLGVDEACRKWDFADDPDGPRFEPREQAPLVHMIDRVLRFDASGNPIP